MRRGIFFMLPTLELLLLLQNNHGYDTEDTECHREPPCFFVLFVSLWLKKQIENSTVNSPQFIVCNTLKQENL